MYLNLREANAALRDAIVRGETIQAKDVINLSRDVSPSGKSVRALRLTRSMCVIGSCERDDQG
jgi:hypothetical protein